MVGGSQCPHGHSLCASSTDQAQVAKELIALQPDVILAQATPLVTALQRESRLSRMGGGPFVARGGDEKMLISYNAAVFASFQSRLLTKQV
jgi:hypothetical protein